MQVNPRIMFAVSIGAIMLAGGLALAATDEPDLEVETTQSLFFSSEDLKPELQRIVGNPANDEVTEIVVRLYPGLYLSDGAVGRERAQTANRAVTGLATCYRTEHRLSAEEATEWARFVFDSTYSAEDGSSFTQGERAASNDLADLGIKPPVDDSEPPSFDDSEYAPELVGPDGEPLLDDDGSVLELVPFPDDENATVYPAPEPDLEPIDESSAESWGPCAEQVGSYLNAVVFGGLVAELESELPRVAVEAQVKAGEIFAAHCEAQDAEKSDDGCEQDLVGLVTNLYPVHREIAAELLRLDLVD